MNQLDALVQKIKCALLVLLFLSKTIVWGQHELIPTGTSTPIAELKKIQNTVIINGVNNFLSKCNDNCDQLEFLNPPGPLNYYNGHVNILDTNTIYISSFMASFPYHAIISKSMNGGQSWTTVLDTISEDFFIRGLFVFDTNNVVLPVSLYNTYVTNNGGNSWYQGPQYTMIAAASSLKINDSTALMGSFDDLSITTNKGTSWQGTGFIQSSPTDFYAKYVDSIYSVTASGIGTYFCYIFGAPQTNRVDKEIPMMDPQGIYVVSKNEIYVIGKGWPQETGRIMKTTDLGDTWTYYNVPETVNLYSMVFLNDTMALLGGNNGSLVKWNKNSAMTNWGLGATDNSNETVVTKVYPNPVYENQIIEINTVPGEIIDVELRDFQGRNCGQVYSGLATGTKQTIYANLSSLETGIYVYHIRISGRTEQILVVKQ